MSEEKIVAEQVDEQESSIEESADEKQENEEGQEELGTETQEEEGDGAEEQEESKPDVAAQMLAELQKVRDELAQMKSSQPPKQTEDHATQSYLEMNVATKKIEEKIKAGNIQNEHAQFYRQLGGLIDEITATNNDRIDRAIASFGQGFQRTINRLKEIDYRGFKRTYGDVDRGKLDSIIKDSGDPFMTYDEAMQKSVLSDPKMLRQFLASQRGGQDKKKTFTPPKMTQKTQVSGQAKFREYLVKGTSDLNMQVVNNLPFDKKVEVMESWGEWYDKQRK